MEGEHNGSSWRVLVWSKTVSWQRVAIGGRSERSLNEAPGSVSSVLEKFAVHLLQTCLVY